MSYDHSPASSTSASFEPAFDYFFADHLLVGGSLFMRYAGGTSGLGVQSSTFTFGGEGRFGADLPLGTGISFEPVAGLGIWQAQTSFDQSAPGYTTSVGGAAVDIGPEVTETAVFVSLYAPLLVHPAAHVFIGLGPQAFRDLTHSVDATVFSTNTQRTFVGISSVVGGWF